MNSYRIFEICKQPYDLLASKNFLYPFVFGMGAFVFAFLWVFEPFGLENLSGNKKLSVIGFYALAVLSLSAIQFLLVQPLIIKKHTVCNTFLWILLHLLLIGLTNAFINSFLWNDGYINLYSILYFQGVVLAVGILPIALFITLHYAWLMRRRAEKALAVNAQLAEKRNVPKHNEEKIVSLKAFNGKIALKRSMSQMILIKSAENYVEIHFYENESIQKVLIRNTLSRIEQQVMDHPVFFRCHKSYIVNKQYVQGITGNAAGYKLHLNKGNYIVPVSRSLNTKIKSIFKD